MTKRAIFVGRWSPFHNGHLAIMKEKIKQNIPLLILVRNTPYDIYSPQLRKRMIESAMSELKVDAKVLIIDDIESVNWGRGVGYEVNEIKVPDDIKRISATQIREMISKKDDSWQKRMPKGAAKVLKNYLSRKGVVIWFTGLPRAGKKTISENVSIELEKRGIFSEKIDSKMLRNAISKDLGFSKDDRNKNLERATFIAKLLSKNGSIVLSSFITPYEKERKKIREEIENSAFFVEVYVKASLETRKQRDKSGIYKKAESGKIDNFSGISDPYEAPKKPDIILDTDKQSIEESTKKIIEYIESLI